MDLNPFLAATLAVGCFATSCSVNPSEIPPGSGNANVLKSDDIDGASPENDVTAKHDDIDGSNSSDAVPAETAAPDAPKGFACTAAACGPAFDLRLDLPLSLEQVKVSTAKVCKNDECFSASLSSISERPPQGGGVNVQFPEPAKRDETHTPLIMVVVWSEAMPKLSLQVIWIPWSLTDVADGDHYKVELRSSAGTLLLGADQTVSSYTISHPNDMDATIADGAAGYGPLCGPTCQTSRFDRRSTENPADGGAD